MYILEGHGFFEDVDTRRRKVGPGTLFCLYPGRWHHFDPDPGTVWTEYWVLFNGDEAERRFGKLLPPPSRPIYVVGRDDSLAEAYERLYEAYLHGGRGYGQQASFLLHRILFGVFTAATGIRTRPGDDLVHRTREAIRLRIGSAGVDFRELAAAQRMSYERFRKKFKAATGHAPKQYHLIARINRARERLLSSDLSVKEMASELGFSDPLYFSRLFKRKTGLSPLQYRRQLSVPGRNANDSTGGTWVRPDAGGDGALPAG